MESDFSVSYASTLAHRVRHPLTKAKNSLNLSGWVWIAILRQMSDDKFTTQAAVLWGVIPLAAKQRILANVFCVKCRGAVQIVNFTGDVDKRGDVILKGLCAVCGNEVVRVLETSEIRNESN